LKRTAILLFAAALACHRQEAARPPVAQTRVPKPAAAAHRAEVGDTMPPYSAAYLDGKPFDLASEKGNVVFVNVWATWCGPCRMEIPELQKLHERYAARGFKVIGVSVDDTGAADVRKFVQEQKIGYPIVLDAEGNLANLLQTTVLPTSVILDPNGKIVWRQVGALMPNEMDRVDAVIASALRRG